MQTPPNTPAPQDAYRELTAADIAALEEATLEAVSPAHVESLGHWRLALDPSRIGRATSAVPLQHHATEPLPNMLNMQSTLDSIEARYAAHGYTAQFRVADVPGLAPWHAALRQRGYQGAQATRTQVHTLAALLAQPLPQARASAFATQLYVSEQPTPAWASVYTGEGFDAQDGAQRVQALSRARHALYAWIEGPQGPLAAGTASLSPGWASVHGLRTLASARQQGRAQELLAALAQAAQARGMERLFLQVEESNPAACALYAKLGFRTAWRYHYWRKISAS